MSIDNPREKAADFTEEERVATGKLNAQFERLGLPFISLKYAYNGVSVESDLTTNVPFKFVPISWTQLERTDTYELLAQGIAAVGLQLATANPLYGLVGGLVGTKSSVRLDVEIGDGEEDGRWRKVLYAAAQSYKKWRVTHEAISAAAARHSATI